MKLFFVLWGFFTFATAMPSEMRRGQDVPPHWQESDRNSSQLHLAETKDVAIQRIDQSVERRQPFVVPTAVAVGVPGAGLVAAIVAVVTLVATEKADDDKRKKFTLGTVQSSIQKWPQYSWIITHSPYAIAFDGVQGQDWGHIHHELPISFGRTIGYEIFCVKSGTFTRYGDGGFINWAYNGYISSTKSETDDTIVTFVARN